MSEQPILTVYNKHSEACGLPPTFDSRQPARRYYGIFESDCGDQWIFVYDYDTKSGTLYGGDVEWTTPHLVQEGQADLILNQAEQIWLMACWSAATAFKGVRPTVDR